MNRTPEAIQKALDEYREVMGWLESYRSHDSDDEENFPYLEIEISRIIANKLDRGDFSKPQIDLGPPPSIKMFDFDNSFLKQDDEKIENENELDPVKIKVITKEMIEKLRPRACDAYFRGELNRWMKDSKEGRHHYTSPVTSPRTDESCSDDDYEDDEYEDEEENKEYI